MDKEKEEIINLLIKNNCIIFGDFLLSSSKKSNIYINLRILISKPYIYEKIINASKKIVEKIDFDVIASIPTGGLPWASFLSYELKKPMVYVRKELKGHGIVKEIEGELKENLNVLIVDDVATTGSNILFAYEKLKKAKCKVANAFVIVDREENAKQNLKNKGINLFSLLKLSEILKLIK